MRLGITPLFISPANTLYQYAVTALKKEKWAVPHKIGDTMKESYLTEEILKARIEDVSKAPSKEVLMVIGYGAVDTKGEKAIKEDLEELVGRVNEASVVHYNLGNSLFQVGQYRQAADQYKKVLSAQPAHHNARQNLEVALKQAS